MKTKTMVVVAFIKATFLACDTQPVEPSPEEIDGDHLAILGPDQETDRAPGEPRIHEEPDYDDPDYVTHRLTELAIEYGPRLDHEEIERLYEGTITSQEALGLSEAEHDALYVELTALVAASERFLAEPPDRVMQRNDDKKPDKPGSGSGCTDEIDDCAFGTAVTAGRLGVQYGPWVFVGIAVAGGTLCACRFCKGNKSIQRVCEVIKQ